MSTSLAFAGLEKWNGTTNAEGRPKIYVYPLPQRWQACEDSNFQLTIYGAEKVGATLSLLLPLILKHILGEITNNNNNNNNILGARYTPVFRED